MHGLLRNKFTYFYTIVYMNNHSFLQEINTIILNQKKLVRPFPSVKRESNRELVSIITLFTLS